MQYALSLQIFDGRGSLQEKSKKRSDLQEKAKKRSDLHGYGAMCIRGSVCSEQVLTPPPPTQLLIAPSRAVAIRLPGGGDGQSGGQNNTLVKADFRLPLMSTFEDKRHITSPI